MIDLDLFFRFLKGGCHGNRLYAKSGELPIFVALAFRNGMGYHYTMGALTAEMTPVYCAKIS